MQARSPSEGKADPGLSGDVGESGFAEPNSDGFAAVFENAPSGVSIVDESGRFIHVNRALCSILGFSLDELRQRTFADVTHPDDIDASLTQFRKLLDGEIDSFDLEKRYRHPDGKTVWAALSVSRVPRPTGNWFVAHIHDITKRKVAERAARLGEIRFRRTFEHAPIGMALCSLDGKAMWVNRALAGMLGCRASDLEHHNLVEWTDPKDQHTVHQMFEHLSGTDSEISRTGLRMRTAAGGHLYANLQMAVVFDEDGSPVYSTVQLQDVTAQRRAEERLLRRLEFEKIATTVATELINVPVEQVDHSIETTLEHVATYAGAERAIVMRYDQENASLSMTHEWKSEGLVSHAGALTKLPLSGFPAFARDLTEGHVCRCDDVGALVGGDALAGQWLSQNGVAAFVAVPLVRQTELYGAIMFAAATARRWDNDSIVLLRIAAQMVFNVLERRSRESSLRDSEERFRQMADNIDQLFWMLGLDPVRLLYASPAMAGSWGFSQQEVARHPMRLLDFVVPEDLNVIADLVSGAMHDATEREYRMVRPDGKIRWLRTRAFPVRDENGKVYRVAGVTDDITTRKRVADELVSRVEMNRLMTDLATGFINLPTDKIADGIDDALARLGRFTKVDIAYVFVLGANGTTITAGHTWYADGQTSIRDIAVGWSIDGFPWFRDRIIGGERVSVDGPQDVPECAIAERRLVEQLGLRSVYVVPMVVEGKSIGWIGFLTYRGQAVWPREHAGMLDVAAEMFANAVARKRAAEELERHREFERLVAHLATDFINRPPSALGEGILRALEDLARVTDTDWVALFLADEGSNHAAPRYQWRSPRFSVPVEPFVVAMGPDDPLGTMMRMHGVVRVDSVAGNHSLAAESKERVSRLGIRAFLDVPLLADGEPFGFLGLAMLSREREWPEQSIVLLKTAAEMLANAILRMRIEQKMRKREAELAHALRLGTMGELAAGLAHELNQPLAAILGFARGCENRARAGNITSADLVSAIGKIADQALRAGEVIRTMRAHVRKGDTKRDWCDLNDLTVDALRLVDDELVQSNVRLERYLADDMPRVQLDATQIEQVFLNLIRNAIDAVRNLPESERRIVISTRINGEGTVDLAVSDSGRAVSTDPEAWFQPFYTTKKHGLGLGLSISRSIAEHHGGMLFVDRDSASGTTFRLRLPCIPGEEHPR